MAETVPGGAYLSTDNKTWHDANGNVIEGEAVKAAEKAAAEREKQNTAVEAQLMAANAQRNPVAQALTGVLHELLAQQPAQPTATKQDK